MDHGAPDIDLVAVHEASLLPTAGDQTLWAQQQVITLFAPVLVKMARCRAASANPPDGEGDCAREDDNANEEKGRIETSGNGQVASDGEEGQECPHTQDTLTGVSQIFSEHEDTDPESDPGEKIQSVW